jgi:hypothetical protein
VLSVNNLQAIQLWLLGCKRKYQSNEVKPLMSLRSNAIYVMVGLAVAAGFLLCAHSLKHVVIGIASAVWGS